MKRRSTILALAFLILAAIVVTTRSSSAVEQEGSFASSASGQGEFTFFNGSTTEQWSYSFKAATNKHDKTRGRAIFNILENFTETQVVVKINCLNAVLEFGTASALMTGTVLRSNDPEFPKHSTIIFGADDNASFPNPLPDIITRPFVFEGGDCDAGGFPLTFFQQSPDAIHIEP
jgi:hypothetical protein